MVKSASPPSRGVKNFLVSFLVGGSICALGQGLIRLYLRLGLAEEAAFPAASITLVFLAALATGLNIFDRLAKHAGGGTLVPITGFSNAMTAAALEFKSEGYVLGLGAKLFTIAGPVIVYGVAAGVIYGLILYLFKLY
ncbi:MAG: SpoVA/SpoVAEb family sporulation membrane protein [Oscillospiraceae bacterium]|nr:SpoVA/SpoVAEb family sporulation membrane protein [Oscillospiraceae bacterium]